MPELDGAGFDFTFPRGPFLLTSVRLRATVAR